MGSQKFLYSYHTSRYTIIPFNTAYELHVKIRCKPAVDSIFNLVMTLLRSRLLRVAVIGVAGVIVQTSFFEVLGIWLEIVRPSTAVIIGAEFGILTNFFLNNRFAFNNQAHTPLSVRLLRFHLVVSGSLLIQWAFVFATEQITTNVLSLHGAYIAGVLFGFVSNYTGYRLWVWRHHDASSLETRI